MQNEETAAGQTQDNNGYTAGEIIFLRSRAEETRVLFEENFKKKRSVVALTGKTHRIALHDHGEQSRSHEKSDNRPPVTKRLSKKNRRKKPVPVGVH